MQHKLALIYHLLHTKLYRWFNTHINPRRQVLTIIPIKTNQEAEAWGPGLLKVTVKPIFQVGSLFTLHTIEKGSQAGPSYKMTRLIA